MRRLIDSFSNTQPWFENKRWHKVKIIIGVDTNPPYPARNALMYIRIVEKMSARKEGSYKKSYSGERIYLTHEQFVRLAMLMGLSRHFWAKTYPKKLKSTRVLVLNFVETWKSIKKDFSLLGKISNTQD
jgi:hypothetical protein